MRRRALLPLVLALAACRSDPVTGKLYYSPIGNDFESQDRYVRENFVTQLMITRDGGLLPEPVIVQSCRRIFAQVLAGVPAEHRRDFRFHLFLSASPQVNAYTYGAGRVHCHLGLVARCEDASEFAGILAHEIGHISHDHFGQGLGRTSVASSILRPFKLPGPQLLYRLGGSLAGFVIVQHTRAQEREADERAVDYTIAAGFDPDGTARFFERMEEDSAGGIELFRTHPSPDDRVARIRRRIGRLPGGGPAGAARSDPGFEVAAARAREILPHYAALEEALAGEEPDRLIEVAGEAIRLLPHHPAFHFWKGVAHEAREERGAALASLRIAGGLDRSNFLVPYVLCLVEFDSRNYERAVAAADALLSILPVLAAPYLLRGASLYELGRVEEAKEDFDLLMRSASRGDRDEILKTIREYAPDYEWR